MEVNKERLALFVAALRSGEFQQGKGCLRETAQSLYLGGPRVALHCCLGVATEVALRNGMDPKLLEQESRIAYPEWGDRGSLPVCVKEWYGFRDLDPILRWRDQGWWETASQVNDNEIPFPDIATMFEEQYIHAT